jgi:hypothetical protein
MRKETGAILEHDGANGDTEDGDNGGQAKVGQR